MNTAHIAIVDGVQVIRLPPGIHLEGDEVTVKRIGRSLLVIPVGEAHWELFQASLDQFTNDYMADRAQPSSQIHVAAKANCDAKVD